MEALRNLLKRGHFDYELSEDMVRKQYIKASDSLKYFVEMECEEKEGGEISKSDFYKRYRDYCKDHNLKIRSKDYVGKHLIEHINAEDDKETKGDRRKRVWKGIAFKEKDDDSTNKTESDIFNYGGANNAD
jgi:hypothetical protein